MPLTTRRWRVSLVAIVAMAVAAALMAGSGDSDLMRAWTSSRFEAPYRRQRSIARALQQEGSLALREELYALATAERSLSTARAGSDTLLRLVAADSVAVRYLPTVRRVVDREWQSLGNGSEGRGDARRVPLHVIVVGELPSAIPLRFAPSTRDASIGRFVLVPRTEGDPCTVIVTLRRAEDRLLEQQLASGEGILGPCAFVAAFGLPAAGLRSALDSIGWRTAAFASWGSAVDRGDSLRPAWLDLSATAVGCLTRADRACLEAWRASADERVDADERMAVAPADPAVWDLVRLPWYPGGSTSLGARERLLVSDLVQASGAATFGAAWRTSGSVEELFVRTVGEPGGTWIATWLARDYRAPVITPLPTAREMTWVLLVGAVAALVICFRPRVRRRGVARP